MKLIEEIREILEKAGYDLVEPGSTKTLEDPKEIRVRHADENRVELEPHIFEGNDIKEALEGYKVSEHNPRVTTRDGQEPAHEGYYSIIIERG